MKKLGLGLLLTLCSIACGDDDGAMDSSTLDAGTDTSSTDSGALDSGAVDSGALDSGALDSGALDSGALDSGADATMDSTVDAAVMDASVEPDGIADVRDAAIGTHDPLLPVRGATVTYVRPEVGDDPPGFFVQAERMGPALFVSVDPSTVSPTPTVGDLVDFDVVETALGTGLLRVIGIVNYARDARGADVAALVQDLSSAPDVVSALDDYESELVMLTGTLATTPIPGGADHVVIRFVTAAIDDAGLLLRTPTDLFLANELQDGCTLTATAPLWRFNATAQAQPLMSADLSGLSCPPLTGDTPAAGELVITEVFFDDGIAGSDDPFEWVEFYNASDARLQLYGCELDDDPAAGALPRRVLEPLSVAPRSYLVLGGAMSEASAVMPFGPALNNGADSVVVRCGGTLVDRVNYSGGDGTPGSSLQLDPRSTSSTLNDDAANWCVATSGFGTRGSFGTPNGNNTTCSVSAELLITEYIEGSSQNKAVEITNVGGASFANLSTCTLSLYSNGAATPTDTFGFPAGALASGESFVVCNTGSDAALMAVCDVVDPITFFNGNDTLVLDCGAVVDVFGQVGFDPGTAWSSGGVSTLNRTLRRACLARADVDDSDGFDLSGWDGFPIDTFDDVGAYAACPF